MTASKAALGQLTAVRAVEAVGQCAAGGLVDVDDRSQLDLGVLAGDAGVERSHRAGADEREAKRRTISVAVVAVGPYSCWSVPRHHWSSVTAPREWLRIKYRFCVGIGFSHGGPSLSRASADRPGTRS